MTMGKLLVVDDDELTREILASILEAEGYEVQQAENGKRAYEFLKDSQDVDLIVCDINMPEMDGIELISLLRGEMASETPLIVLSGNDQVAVAIEAINKGASAYLIKDENIDQTVSIAVEQALDKKRIVDENRQLMEAIKVKNEELSGIVHTMTDVGTSLSSKDSTQELLDVVIECGKRLTNAQGGILYLASGDKLAPKAWSLGSEEVELVSMDLSGNRPAQSSQEKGLPVIIDNIDECTSLNVEEIKRYCQAGGISAKSLLAVPLKGTEGGSVGVLQLINAKGKLHGKVMPFDEGHSRYIESLAAQAALVIENTRLHEENIRATRLSALGEGIAGAAHCVKNILTGFDGGRYILDVGLKKGKMEKIEQGWEMLKRNSDILKQLVLDMLDYSKARTPEFSETDVNELCENIASLEKEKAHEKNAKLILSLEENLCKATIDGKAIYRAILNLVGNAVDALPETGGTVTITTKSDMDAKELLITVADTGCGIKPENLENIFKPFFSTKGAKQGTGLGLAVTQKVIGEHGGDLSVESELGKGTTFVICLPIEPI